MKQNPQAWPYRPWILAAFLSLVGLIFNQITEDKIFLLESPQLRMSLATFTLVAATSFAFALEKTRYSWVAIFSMLWGFILAFVAHSTLITHSGRFDFSYSFCSGLIAAGIALPLFQTIRSHGKLALPYKDLHENAWSDVICWCASWVFVALSFGLAHLLASLFNLIGFELLKELLSKQWFIFMFLGGSFGAALGVFKENERIVASLQNLVMSTMSILAPVLCVSLIVFLAALPFTGLQPLWDATRGTTPILLACTIGAITLINAIIRNSESEESDKKMMRYAAKGLSFCILPLAIIALMSMQQRITQYGLTPDRIWGFIAVLVALAYGLAYLWSLIKSPKVWSSNLRTNNIRMAILLCLTTLFLALPIVNFAKLSVNSQLERISSGRAQAESVDFAAFAFDFGEEGKDALREMKNSENQYLLNGATLALAADNRWNLEQKIEEAASSSLIFSKLSVFPKPVAIPDKLKQAINKEAGCIGDYCLLIWQQGADIAQLVTEDCTPYSRYLIGNQSPELGYQHCPPKVTHLNKVEGDWLTNTNSQYSYKPLSGNAKQKQEDKLTIANAIKQGEVEIRSVERKQLFIGGKPVGQVY